MSHPDPQEPTYIQRLHKQRMQTIRNGNGQRREFVLLLAVLALAVFVYAGLEALMSLNQKIDNGIEDRAVLAPPVSKTP